MVINLTPNLDQIKHISQHEYYNHASQFVVIPTDKYDSANDRFFNVVDPDERIPLYKLMSQYCTEDQNQDYIIGDDHPMYVDPKDTTGISIPDMDGIQAKDGYFHENQQLKLKVTDVNTNSPSAGKHAFSIEAQWVIVDQDGLNSNDVSTFT
jgi:hypothetical protein